jgi:hypothetical protein
MSDPVTSIAPDVLDRVLGRVDERPSQADMDAVCLDAAGIVDFNAPVGLMVARALAELIERRDGRWREPR